MVVGPVETTLVVRQVHPVVRAVEAHLELVPVLLVVLLVV